MLTKKTASAPNSNYNCYRINERYTLVNLGKLTFPRQFANKITGLTGLFRVRGGFRRGVGVLLAVSSRIPRFCQDTVLSQMTQAEYQQ